MSRWTFGSILLGVFFVFSAACPPAFADDESTGSTLMNVLGSLLGGNSQQSGNGYSNNGYYDNGGYQYNDALEQDYETLRSRETSVRRSEQQLNEAYRQMEARRAAGQDVSSDEQNIANLRQSYQNDLNQYQRDRAVFEQRRNRLRSQQGYQQQYNRRQPYQSDEDLQDYYNNLERSRISVARSEQQLNEMRRQMEERRAAGQDVSADEQAIASMQQSYENDINQYERDRSALYRQKNVSRRAAWSQDDGFSRPYEDEEDPFYRRRARYYR